MTITQDSSAPVAGTDIKLGTTLYSLSNEWVERVYTLETILDRVAEVGVGPGVEIVGFQSIRTFPDVTTEFVRTWRGLLEKYGLVGSCLGSNIDVALRRDRMLTTDEMVSYLSRQLHTAHELGFPIVRIQMGATAEVIEAVTPLAERLGIVLGMEVHAPEGGRTPSVRAVNELFKRIESPNLGFIPDFSSTMHRIPEGMLELYRRHGLTMQHTNRLQEIWAEDAPIFDRYTRWADEVRATGAPEDGIQRAQISFTMFGHETIESWSELADRIVHVHGKCYEIDAVGDEPNIDYGKLMGFLVAIGYDGYISTEWEGHGFRDVGDLDPFDIIAGQHRLETRAIEAAVQGR